MMWTMLKRSNVLISKMKAEASGQIKEGFSKLETNRKPHDLRLKSIRNKYKGFWLNTILGKHRSPTGHRFHQLGFARP